HCPTRTPPIKPPAFQAASTRFHSCQVRHSPSVIVIRSCPLIPLTGCSLSASAQVIEIQSCVKDEEEAALRLMPPHRIVREHHYVTLSNRYVYDSRSIHEFRASRQHTAN